MSTEPTGTVGNRLIFENDRVRVWDLALAPGEALPPHLHRNDYFFVVVNGGKLRQDDPNEPDNPELSHKMKLDDDLVVFSEAGEGLLHGRLVNVGEAPYRNLVIELL